MNRTALITVVCLLSLSVTGCSTSSSNMRVGTDQTYLSLKDQRDAALTVKEYPVVPDGSFVVGKVDASRCHRNALHTAPSETEILIDLKAVAFAKGADGIAEVKYSKGTGFLQNCWSILDGEAVAFTVKK